MGKKGDALRAAKRQIPRLYTDEQIAAIKEQAVRDYVERYRNSIINDATTILGNELDNARVDTFCMVGAIPLDVLIQKFGWKAPSEYENPINSRAYKFFKAMDDKITELLESGIDLKEYAAQCEEKYGMGYQTVLEETND